MHSHHQRYLCQSQERNVITVLRAPRQPPEHNALLRCLRAAFTGSEVERQTYSLHFRNVELRDLTRNLREIRVGVAIHVSAFDPCTTP
jgi:hypothetical protein